MNGGARRWSGPAWRVGAAVVAAGAAALLADRAGHGVAVTRAAAGPAATGPWWVVVAGVALLAVTGALPSWRLAGTRPIAVFLAPCIGALVAAVSAAVTVTVGSEPLRWFVAFAAAANAAALASTAARPARRSRPRLAPVALLVAVAAAVVYGASALGRVAVTPVAAHTWLALAPPLASGHRAVEATLSVSGPSTAVHLLSSPVAAGAAAVTWLVSGSRSVAAATAVSALVTAAAVGVAACAIGEVPQALLGSGGEAPDGEAAPGGPAAGQAEGGGSGRAGTAPLRVAGIRGVATLAACGFALATAGAGGRPALGGDQTLLWSAALAAAAVLTLLLPPTGWRLRVALPLGALVALAAPLGALSAAVLVVAVTVRRVVGRPGANRGAWRLLDVAAALVGLAAVAAWPAAAAVVGAGPAPPALPPSGGTARLHAAWHVLGPTLWPAAAAGVLAAVGTVVVGRWRRRQGVASDAGPGLVAVVSPVAAVLAAGWAVPLVRPLLVEPVVLSGVSLLVVAVAVVAVWAVVAAAAAVTPMAPGAGAGGAAAPGGPRPAAVLEGGDHGARGPGPADGTVGGGRFPAAAAQVDGWPGDVLHPSA